MKGRYADGGDVYTAEMGEPPMPDEGARGLMSLKERMGQMNIGTKADLPKGYVHRREPMERGEEVGVRREKRESYKRKFAAGGSASSRADGCAQRGKTKGKFV